MIERLLKQLASQLIRSKPIQERETLLPKKHYLALLRWLMPNGGTLILLLLYIGISHTWGAPTTNPTPITSATEINFSGYLADDNGNPLTGNYEIKVAIYDQETNGTLLWGPETHLNVPVTQGNWTLGIGSVIPGGVPTSLWSGNRYLQIIVEGEVLSPRQLIRSVPIAGLALTVPDRAITASKLAVDALPGEAVHVTMTETIVVGATNQIFASTSTEITVSQRSNILLTAKADANALGTGGYYAGVCRDGIVLGPTHRYTPDVIVAPPFEKYSWAYIDTVEAGTYTYTLCVQNSSPTSVQVSWYRAVINLVAFPAP